jgi:serine/threonine-protein kinase PpkA
MMAVAENNAELPEIPGFRMIRALGRGGMAQVYLALQESIDREVAIKVMLSALNVDDSFSERFLREARISAKLSHPNIVSVYDVGVANGMHYLAMEYLPGGDLKDRIRRGLAVKDALRIMREIASALDFAHKKGFVHRDIKPENILFSQTGAAVLSDFGIARTADGGTHLTATGSIVGTPHYMSPEQAQGKPVDGRSDLYSLGIAFYQMLTGKIPYQGDSALSIGIKHMRDPIPDLPQGLAAYQPFLERLLAKDPDARWQSGAEVVRALEIMEIEGDEAGSATIAATIVSSPAIGAKTEVMPSGEQRGKSRMPLAIVALAIVAVAAGGGYLYMQGLIPGLESRTPAPVATKDSGATARSERIASLLAGAQGDMKVHHYIDPADDNAYDKYRSVLALDKANPKALSGLRAISNALIARAREAMRRKRLDAAAGDLARSRQIDAKNPELAVAEAELAGSRKRAGAASAKRLAQQRQAEEAKQQVARRAAQRQARINHLVDEASTDLDPQRLTESRVMQAYSAYQSAHSIAPGDQSVNRLPDQIADSYEILADDQRAAKHWSEAKRLVHAGLNVVPDHRGLRRLSAQIDSDQKSASSDSARRTFGGF